MHIYFNNRADINANTNVTSVSRVIDPNHKYSEFRQSGPIEGTICQSIRMDGELNGDGLPAVAPGGVRVYKCETQGVVQQGGVNGAHLSCDRF